MSTIEESEFADYALQLGYLCIIWTSLENDINTLVATLMSLPVGDERNAVIANVDLRQKIQIALALGYLKRPSDVWFNHLKSALDKIDNDLRPSRNRYIHDHWMWDQANVRMMKRTLKTTLKKPQAFQPFEFSSAKDIPVDAKEILGFRHLVGEGTVALKFLWFSLAKQSTHKAWLAESPPQFPPAFAPAEYRQRRGDERP